MRSDLNRRRIDHEKTFEYASRSGLIPLSPVNSADTSFATVASSWYAILRPTRPLPREISPSFLEEFRGSETIRPLYQSEQYRALYREPDVAYLGISARSRHPSESESVVLPHDRGASVKPRCRFEMTAADAPSSHEFSVCLNFPGARTCPKALHTASRRCKAWKTPWSRRCGAIGLRVLLQ